MMYCFMSAVKYVLMLFNSFGWLTQKKSAIDNNFILNIWIGVTNKNTFLKKIQIILVTLKNFWL